MPVSPILLAASKEAEVAVHTTKNSKTGRSVFLKDAEKPYNDFSLCDSYSKRSKM